MMFASGPEGIRIATGAAGRGKKVARSWESQRGETPARMSPMFSTPARLPGYQTVARTATRDCPVALHQRGGHYVITSCSQVLMSSEDTGSERALGRLTGRLLRRVQRPRVLVGGLGMGYTLRALLDRLPWNARVLVAELLPPVARWNQERLGHLSAHPVDDPRVRLRIVDVARLATGRPVWDAIVLDVDNGPEWIVQRGNRALYEHEGLARFVGSLRSGGFLAVWSAGRYPVFERRLAAMGLRSHRFRRVSLAENPAEPVLYVISAQARARHTRPVQPSHGVGTVG